MASTPGYQKYLLFQQLLIGYTPPTPSEEDASMSLSELHNKKFLLINPWSFGKIAKW
jgi:hypothetical protein